MKIRTSFFCLTLLVSCVSAPDNYQLLEGEWRNISLQLVQHSLNNSGKDSVLVIENGQWDSILRIRPIRTTYLGDGTFVSRYYNLNDSLLFESGGTWHFIGDSLYLATEEGVTAYHFKMLENGQARFIARLDWDSDGHSDDLYDGVQQKQKNN